MEEWLKILGQLTGEEIYNLIRELDKAQKILEDTGTPSYDAVQFDEPYATMCNEVGELREQVLMQVARITVPMNEAAAIVFRARFARGHPVRMNPGGSQ